MNTPVTEDVYQKPRPPSLKPRLQMHSSVSEPVNQQMPFYLEMLQAEGSQNMREHAANTACCSSDVRIPPPLPVKSKMRRASENTPCRPGSPKSLPRLPEQELYQNPNPQPVTDHYYSIPHRPPPPPPPPLNKPPRPPVQRSISEPQMPSGLYVLPAEVSQFCLPETFQSVRTPYNSQPPLFTSPESANQALPKYHNTEELEGDDEWNKLQRSVESHRIVSGLDPLTVSRYLTNLAIQMRIALCFFHSMMLITGEKLRSNITELHSIADNLDKVQKSTRAMGITGGATGAVGGVTAVVGIALAPVTMGASLIATAVGAGVAVAGTGLGAGAAVKKKKTGKVDRKRLERVVQEYQTNITEVEKRLGFILSGMVQIHSYDMARVTSLDAEAAWVVRLVEKVYQENASLSSGTFQNQVLNTGVLKAFELWVDIFFTDNGQKVKKGLKSKFGENIRTMARQLQEGLDQVYKMWDLFKQFATMV